MEWFIAVVVVATLGVAAMAAAGGMGEMSKDPVRDTYRQDLPVDRLLAADDIQRLRFGITLRGYAMGQVDDLLDRLATEIAERDARIAELTDRVEPAPVDTAPADPPPGDPAAAPGPSEPATEDDVVPAPGTSAAAVADGDVELSETPRTVTE